MSGMPWLKLFNGAHTDPLFPALADMAGSTPGAALGVYFQLCEFANEHDDRGSIAGWERIVPIMASYLRVSIDEVKRIVGALAELGKLAADRIVAFAKRQGVTGATVVRMQDRSEGRMIPGAPSPATGGGGSTARVRRLRMRRRLGGEQLDMFFSVRGGRPVAVENSAPPVDNSAAAPALHRPETPVTSPRIEREREQDFSLTKDRSGSFCRFAAPVAIAPDTLRQRKRELWIDKLVRFAHSHLAGAALEAAMIGMAGADEAHEQKWWLDRLDKMMRAEGWDDRRQAA